MNKNRVNKLIPEAYDIIGMHFMGTGTKVEPEANAGASPEKSDTGIALSKDKKEKKESQAAVLSALRSQISSFGAAVTTGSLVSSVAFFSQQGNAKSPRPILLKMIFELLKTLKRDMPDKYKTLFAYVRENDNEKVKDEVLDCAVAIKLAMNLYDLGKK